MSAGLTQQLAGYGDVFAAEVDALTRETTMTTDEAVVSIDRNEHKKKSPWQRVGALVGAAAMAIAAVAGVALLRSESDAIAAPPFATAEDAALARENALEVGDWEAFRAAFADEGVDSFYTDGRPFSVNEEKAVARFSFDVALGVRNVVESCSVTFKDTVTCTVAMTDDVIEGLGAEPIIATREYRTSDGLLAFVGSPSDVFVSPIIREFQEWLRETEHPALALGVEFSRRPVIGDGPVAAAAMLEATDEFLAQYEG